MVEAVIVLVAAQVLALDQVLDAHLDRRRAGQEASLQ